MAWTQDNLDALDAAIALGATEVRYGDKVIKYQTTEDLLAARNAMARDIALQATPTRVSPRYQLADFSDD